MRPLSAPTPRQFASLAPLAALTLAACSTVPLPPAGDAAANATAAGGQVPIIDASIRSHSPAAAAASPTATPVASSQVQALPAADAPHGLHLQAGAFASQASADAAASAIRAKVPSLAQKVSVAPRGANFRVLVGPFADNQARQAAAGAIRTQTGSEVVNAAP